MKKKQSQWRVKYAKNGEVIDLDGDSELDEIVLDTWFHMENMSENEWWIRVGDARVWVEITDSGPEITVERNVY